MIESNNIAGRFREVMRNFPQGVTVIACMFEGEPFGMTVSSFISVSMQPPLLLVSVMKGNKLHQVFVNTSYFSVNLLAEDQAELSERFSRTENMKRRFENTRFSMHKNSLPIIDGCVASLICRRWKNFDVGDHTIIIGRVIETFFLQRKLPLVYYRRGYTTVKEK